jgi:hypothetical protein
LLHERTSDTLADGLGERVTDWLGGRVTERLGGRAAERIGGRVAERLSGLAAERAAKRPGSVEQLPWLSEAVKKRILSLALGEKVSEYRKLFPRP